MSALDKMKLAMGGVPKEAPQQIGQKQPSMMEQAMLRMLEGVGLDAAALGKMQTDVQTFAQFCKDNLEAIRQENAQILTNQAGILALLTEIADNDRHSRDDGPGNARERID